eukprot:6535101-Pyramimonas_sp.AAC.1
MRHPDDDVRRAVVRAGDAVPAGVRPDERGVLRAGAVGDRAGDGRIWMIQGREMWRKRLSTSATLVRR